MYYLCLTWTVTENLLKTFTGCHLLYTESPIHPTKVAANNVIISLITIILGIVKNPNGHPTRLTIT